MRNDWGQRIKKQYENSRGDSTLLFEEIMAAAAEIGLDSALEILQKCVTEKRLVWLENNIASIQRTGNPLLDGYRLFYEKYLDLSVPRDGEIIEAADRRLVMRWWNRCPTLDACQKLGLDTRVICRQAYHLPVQAMLSRVDPRLVFRRNYDALRPHAPYCEEIIELKL
jgi:hypothetical protein